MNDIPLKTFEQAIYATHGAAAELAERVAVVETSEGETLWEGEVLVFQLQNHPTAWRCYCWEGDGEVTAVLHEGSVDSPDAAVRASIMADGPESRRRRVRSVALGSAAASFVASSHVAERLLF